jgi:hypothetical protein
MNTSAQSEKTEQKKGQLISWPFVKRENNPIQ